MKITVKLSIDVDPNAWHEVYGTGIASKDVVNDVRQYVLDNVQATPGIQDSQASVTLGR
jgi:hypothetical protein